MLLSVNDIHVYYGAIHAVKGVSLEVNEGEVVTLIGANGAGKSTVLNTISGLLRAKSGTIDFMGTPINTMAPNKIVQLGLAQCPEGRRVFAHMTVEENLEMGAYTRPNSTIEGNLEHVYELFPRLKERRKQVGGTLSGGEQQMLKSGATILLVEQNAQMALQVANRAYVLETGKITLAGSGKELLESDSIKKAYLGG